MPVTINRAKEASLTHEPCAASARDNGLQSSGRGTKPRLQRASETWRNLGNDDEVIAFVTNFREHMLRVEGTQARPRGMCFHLCRPLAALLRNSGVEVELYESHLGDPVLGENHAWLKLADGRALDPTPDQFDKVCPRSTSARRTTGRGSPTLTTRARCGEGSLPGAALLRAHGRRRRRGDVPPRLRHGA